MNLVEYVESRPTLSPSLKKMMRYLPIPLDAEVYVGLPLGVLPVYGGPVKTVVKAVTVGKRVWFAEDPPSPYVFEHELVHLSGIADENLAVAVHYLINYADAQGLDPFDATAVLRVGVAGLNVVARELGFECIEDLFAFVGTLLAEDIANRYVDEKGWSKVRLRDDLPKEYVLGRVLIEVVAGLDAGEPIFDVLVRRFLEVIRGW